MHIVTMLGNSRVGKTALCQLWSTGIFTKSYMATLTIDHYLLENFTIHDTPSHNRFHVKLEILSSDIFVLVANEDTDYDPWYARIQPNVPSASWIFIWTNIHDCPKRKKWALEKNIIFKRVSLDNEDEIAESFTHLEELSKNHAARPERLSLNYIEFVVDETRQWIGCV
jgi:hypothetical protein